MRYDKDLCKIKIALRELVTIARRGISSALSYDEDDCSDILVKDGSFIYYVFAIMLVWLLLLSRGQSSTFIYFQF